MAIGGADHAYGLRLEDRIMGLWKQARSNEIPKLTTKEKNKRERSKR
jgi:hypothetical protein